MKNVVRVYRPSPPQTGNTQRHGHYPPLPDHLFPPVTAIPSIAARRECWRTFVFCRECADFRVVQSPSKPSKPARPSVSPKSAGGSAGPRLAENHPSLSSHPQTLSSLAEGVQNDHLNRAESAKAELTFALKRDPMVDVLLQALAGKTIPNASPTTIPNSTTSCSTARPAKPCVWWIWTQSCLAAFFTILATWFAPPPVHLGG